MLIFISLCALHVGPKRLSIRSNGIEAAARTANSVKHHPIPIVSIMIRSTANPIAAKEHRIRFELALTVDGRRGLRSTARVPHTLKIIVVKPPMRN